MNTLTTTCQPATANPSEGCPPAALRPAHRVRKSDAGHEVTVALPGVAKDQIRIRFEDDRLRIEADRLPFSQDGWRTLASEIPAGRFTLDLDVRVPVDRDAITARHADGLLTVTLPTPATLSREISIA